MKPDNIGRIIDGEELNQKIARLLPNAKDNIVFISAYITQSAVDWFLNHVPNDVPTQIVCRLTPSDVLNGSTQLSALKTALLNGVKISCLHSLHAKIYAIDNQSIFVGSANLTNNGLKIYGCGNLEACNEVPANNQNLSFIKNIVVSATPIDEEIIKNMQGCIDLKEKSIFMDCWPEGVLKEQEGIWVRDFFWTKPTIEESSVEQIHDFELLGIETAMKATDVATKKVLQARCIKWLFEKLKTAPEQELYFGTLTQILHDDLKDDPSPYRKDVKDLVQNLLFYCEAYLSDYIEISRPRHSQRIKLLKNSNYEKRV